MNMAVGKFYGCAAGQKHKEIMILSGWIIKNSTEVVDANHNESDTNVRESKNF